MHTWFECKVRYVKIDEKSGKEKKVSEPYLVDAITFTEAEGRLIKELEQMIRGDFQITNIRKANYSDVFSFDDGDRWYKCRVSYLSVDELAGKEKMVVLQMLVMANNLKEAYDNLMTSLSGMTIDFDVTAITEILLMDIFPYSPNEEQDEEDDDDN
ncbi:MAG: DUF4494 domain-containing protein [Cytophagaceae bacterium]|jgi:hypothetical protein|nr:DUF4494 domain-containing protein [Cytophagaceae bacterium]